MIRWHRNGTIESKTFYLNGLKEGQSITYDDNGNKVIEENYKNDTLNGFFRQWYPNGTLKIEGSYSNGLFEGRWMYLIVKIYGNAQHAMNAMKNAQEMLK